MLQTKTLLAFIALSSAQSSAQTRIHSAIMVTDTSNNASYNQADWLVRTQYLSIKASGEGTANRDLYGNTNLVIIPILPFLCVCENRDSSFSL